MGFAAFLVACGQVPATSDGDSVPPATDDSVGETTDTGETPGTEDTGPEGCPDEGKNLDDVTFLWWYAGAPGDARWVTDVLADAHKPEAWSAVGARPLQWKWGYSAPWSTMEAWRDNWLDVDAGQAGILIDEFGTGGAEDEIMGQALLEVREARPDLFLATYCQAVSGPRMIDAFSVADVVLLETYAEDWRAYPSRFDARLGTAITAGLGDHTLAALGMSAQSGAEHWVTTDKELRQQIAYLRTRYPDLPGLSLFGTMSGHMVQAVDDAIYDYFLGPAVRLSDDGRTVTNLGKRTAEEVELRFADGSSSSIACLLPGAAEKLSATASEVLASDRYTVVAWHDPTTLPPPDAAATAEAFEWRSTFSGSAPLDSEPEIELAYDAGGDVESGTVAFDAISGDVALAFQLTATDVSYYGEVGVALTGDGEMGFTWYRGDDDADLAVDQARATLRVTDDQGWVVTETFPPAMEEGLIYTFFVSWDATARSVRAMMLDDSDALVWDTTPLAVEGDHVFDALRFYTRPADGSAIRYEDPGAVYLSGGAVPYRIEAVVGQVTVGVR